MSSRIPAVPTDKAIHGARTVWEHVLRLSRGSTALTICDDETLDLGFAFHQAARELGHRASWLVIPRISEETGEPVSSARAALCASESYIAITSAGAKSLTHTRARRLASGAGARGLTLPGFTLDMLSRAAIRTDYGAIAAATESLATRLNGTSEIHIVSDGGTDLRLDVRGGEWFAERGLCDNPGQFSNLPGGEVSIAPVNSNGILVVDGSMSWIGILESPLRITIAENRIVQIEGDAAHRLRSVLEPFGQAAFEVAEIGIGMNPKAALCGNTLEDEKILGSVHIGLGDNSNMGGFSLARVVEAPIHGDGVVVSNPRIYADGSLVDPRTFFDI
jgi:leucyl aminopeptidase (aminopeptidase T)